jgi:hypothetical protein
MSKQHRASNLLLLECSKCHRRYGHIKNAMRTCGAMVGGVTCGGMLRPIEKRESPK